MVQFRIDIVADPSKAVQANQTVQRELQRTEGSADRLRSTLTRAFAAIGAGLAAREVLGLANTYAALQNRLRLVTDGQENLAATTNELFAIANRTRSSFEGTAELYARLGIAAKELGRTQKELLQFTESLNQAILLSGASGTEAQAGLIQLSQGLASGTLRGDELRSVLEQLPAVADVIAKGLGITRGELRKLGAEGKITAEIVLDAFKSARQELADNFGKTITTLPQAFQVLRNNLLQFVGETDRSLGATRALAGGIGFLAQNVDVLAAAVVGLGGAFALVKLGPLVAQAAQAVAAQIALQRAISAGTVTVLGSAQADAQKAAAAAAAAQADLSAAQAALVRARANEALTAAMGNSLRAEAARQTAALRTAAVEAEVAAATTAAAAAQARAGAAAAVAAGQATLFGRALTFARTAAIGGPFILLAAGITGAVLALNELNEGLDEYEQAQKDIRGEGVFGDNGLRPKIFATEQALKRLQATFEKTGDTRLLPTIKRFETDLKGLRGEMDALVKSIQAQETTAARAAPAFTKYIAELAQEARILKIVGAERKVQERTLKALNDLQKEGVKLTPETAKQVEDQIRANEALRAQAELLEAIRGPQDEYNQRLAAGNALIAQGLITQQELDAFLAGQTEDPAEKIRERNEALKELIQSFEGEGEILQAQIAGQYELAEAHQTVLDLRRQGVELTQAEKEVLVAATKQNAALRDRLRVIESLRQPQQELNKELVILNGLLTDPAPGVNVDLVRRRIRDLQIAGLEASTDLGDGFTRAFLKIAAEAENLAAVGEAVVNTFADNATDALVEFARTGEFSFKEFASSVLDDLTRILARLLVVQALSAAFGGFGGGAAAAAGAGGANFGGFRAEGGPVLPGHSYVVGDGGEPEVFTPSQPGHITPMSQINSQPQVNVNVTNVTDPNEVPSLIASGRADQDIVNVLARNAQKVNRILGSS